MASGDDEWFADESIWKDLYPFTFPESAFAVGDEQVEKILRLTGVGRGKVLDLCCGPGRHTVALAKRGFAVTAVDRTRFIINLFTSFGYFEDQADDFRVLELVAKISDRARSSSSKW